MTLHSIATPDSHDDDDCRCCRVLVRRLLPSFHSCVLWTVLCFVSASVCVCFCGFSCSPRVCLYRLTHVTKGLTCRLCPARQQQRQEAAANAVVIRHTSPSHHSFAPSTACQYIRSSSSCLPGPEKDDRRVSSPLDEKKDPQSVPQSWSWYTIKRDQWIQRIKSSNGATHERQNYQTLGSRDSEWTVLLVPLSSTYAHMEPNLLPCLNGRSSMTAT